MMTGTFASCSTCVEVLAGLASVNRARAGSQPNLEGGVHRVRTDDRRQAIAAYGGTVIKTFVSDEEAETSQEPPQPPARVAAPQ
jgi:hypothetical protein